MQIEINNNSNLIVKPNNSFANLKKGKWFLARDFFGGNVRKGTQLLLKISDDQAVYTDGVIATPNSETYVRSVNVLFTIDLEQENGI